MTITASGVWNARTTATANNANGGYFNAALGGVDYTLQDAAQLTQTDGTGAGTTNFASVIGGFTSQMVGNGLHITASTGLTVGWYEIVAFVDANNVTLDRSPGTGSATTFYVGGALSLVSTLDDDVFEAMGTAPPATMYVKSGTYVLGEAVTIAATGNASNPFKIIGYNATPGDTPTDAQRPVFTLAGNAFTMTTNWEMYNLVLTGTSTAVLSVTANGKAVRVKATNSSTTAARAGIGCTSADTFIDRCEGISYRGNGVTASASSQINGCYCHDSNIGINISATGSYVVSNCISESNFQAAINVGGAVTSGSIFSGNTLFGGTTNKLGTGINFVTGVTDVRVINNIITGFVTGVAHADTQTVGFDNYNDYYNNPADVSAAGQWQKGANDSTADPTFTAVTQVAGTTATTNTSGGNHLVDTNATFTTSGVVAGDIVRITGGTAGPVLCNYSITSVDSETQLTLGETVVANATADHTWVITTAANFAIGTNLKALGYPGTFPGGLTVGYMDIGAAQRQEAGSGGGGPLVDGRLAK